MTTIAPTLFDQADRLEAEQHGPAVTEVSHDEPARSLSRLVKLMRLAVDDQPVTVNGAPYVPGSATSAQAAAQIVPSAPNQRARVLAYLRLHGPLSDQGIALGLNMPENTIRPRRRELEKGGEIRKAGTAKTTTGRSAVTWEAV